MNRLLAHQIWLRVEKGERPPVTAADADGAPEGYVALMRELWHQDPVERPTFAEALRRLRAMTPRKVHAAPAPGQARELDLVSDLFEGGGSAGTQQY